MAQQCEECATPFESHYRGGPRQRFCTARCAGRAYRRTHPEYRPIGPPMPRERRPSPEVWNGRTQYSEVPTPKEDYRLSCVMCGDLRTFKMTRARADLLRKAGLFGRCLRCGSSTLEFERDQGVRSNVAHLVGWARTPLDNWETTVDAGMSVP